MVVDKEQPVPKWLKINHKFFCFKKKVRDDSIIIEKVQTTEAMWEKLETLANKTILVFQIILTIFVQVRYLENLYPNQLDKTKTWDQPGYYLIQINFKPNDITMSYLADPQNERSGAIPAYLSQGFPIQISKQSPFMTVNEIWNNNLAK